MVLRMFDRGMVCETPGVTWTVGTGRDEAGAPPVRAGAAEGTKASTSRFTMRPPGPEPGISSIGRCFSAATFLARGEALTRPPVLLAAGAAAGAGAGRGAGAGVGAAAGFGAAGAEAAGAAGAGAAGAAAAAGLDAVRSFAAWASKAEMSSSFEP